MTSIVDALLTLFLRLHIFAATPSVRPLAHSTSLVATNCAVDEMRGPVVLFERLAVLAATARSEVGAG